MTASAKRREGEGRSPFGAQEKTRLAETGLSLCDHRLPRLYRSIILPLVGTGGKTPFPFENILGDAEPVGRWRGQSPREVGRLVPSGHLTPE